MWQMRRYMYQKPHPIHKADIDGGDMYWHGPDMPAANLRYERGSREVMVNGFKPNRSRAEA